MSSEGEKLLADAIDSVKFEVREAVDEYLEENNQDYDLTPDDVRDNIDDNGRITDIYDSNVPIHNQSIMEIGTLPEVYSRESELGPAFGGEPTPINLIAGVIYDILSENAWEELRTYLDELEENGAFEEPTIPGSTPEFRLHANDDKKEIRVNKLVARHDDEFYVLDTLFRHSDDFSGATGTGLRPVPKDEYEQRTSDDAVEERVEDVWREDAGSNGGTTSSLEDYARDMYRYDGDEMIFDFSGYDMWDQIRELGFDEDDYPVIECTGGGRMFSPDMKLDEIYDDDLWELIVKYEKGDFQEEVPTYTPEFKLHSPGVGDGLMLIPGMEFETDEIWRAIVSDGAVVLSTEEYSDLGEMMVTARTDILTDGTHCYTIGKSGSDYLLYKIVGEDLGIDCANIEMVKKFVPEFVLHTPSSSDKSSSDEIKDFKLHAGEVESYQAIYEPYDDPPTTEWIIDTVNKVNDLVGRDDPVWEPYWDKPFEVVRIVNGDYAVGQESDAPRPTTGYIFTYLAHLEQRVLASAGKMFDKGGNYNLPVKSGDREITVYMNTHFRKEHGMNDSPYAHAKSRSLEDLLWYWRLILEMGEKNAPKIPASTKEFVLSAYSDSDYYRDQLEKLDTNSKLISAKLDDYDGNETFRFTLNKYSIPILCDWMNDYLKQGKLKDYEPEFKL